MQIKSSVYWSTWPTIFLFFSFGSENPTQSRKTPRTLSAESAEKNFCRDRALSNKERALSKRKSPLNTKKEPFQNFCAKEPSQNKCDMRVCVCVYLCVRV